MRLGLYTALLAGTVFAAVGQLSFKLGASGRQSLVDLINPWIIGGLVAYGVGTVLWILALTRLDLTIVYPFTALTFVLVFAAGVLLLGEPVSAIQMGGVMLVLVGLLLITIG